MQGGRCLGTKGKRTGKRQEEAAAMPEVQYRTGRSATATSRLAWAAQQKLTVKVAVENRTGKMTSSLMATICVNLLNANPRI